MTREPGIADGIQHLLGCDGLVNADGVDPHFTHQGEVLGEVVKAALLFTNGHRVVADALDEKGGVALHQLAIFCPDLMITRRGAGGGPDPEQNDHGGDQKTGR